MNFTKTAVAMGSAIGIRDLIKTIEGVHIEDVLNMIGLERKPSTLGQLLPAAGLITVSAAVGAGIALLLAPTSGSKLRARLSDGIDDAKHRLSDRISHYESSPAHRHSIS
ncbi:MAG: YtxH domain-containing protein [Myxococcales bacterium]